MEKSQVIVHNASIPQHCNNKYYLRKHVMRKHVGEKLHTCDVYQFLTMQCLGDVLTKTLPYDVLDDVLKKPKHRAYDAY